MRFKAMVLCILIMSGLLTAVAGKDHSFTLSRCLDMALERNLEIRDVQNRLKQAGLMTRQSVSAFLPTVDVSGQHILKEKVMVVEFPSMIPGEPPSEVELDMTRNFQFTLQAVQPLFTGGHLLYNLKQAREFKRIQEYMVQAKEDEIRARTATTYYMVLLLEKSREISFDGLKLAETIRDQIQVMYQEGLVKKLDVLQARNRISQMKMQLKDVESRIVEAKNRLKTLLNIPLEDSIAIADSFVKRTWTLDRKPLVEKMMAVNPLLNSLENQVRAKKLGVKQAYGNLLPRLNLAAQYNVMGDRLDALSDWYNFYTISLNLQVPLFRGLATHFNIARRKAEKTDALINREISRSKYLTMLTNSLETDQMLLQKIEYTRNHLKSTAEELEIARELYREGMISYAELEQIHNKFLTARFKSYQSYFEYYSNIFHVETLVSESIFSVKGDVK